MKKIKIILTLFLLILLIFSACSSKDVESTDHSVSFPDKRFGISQHGLIEEIDGVIWFYDFESGEKVILCNKPDCDHEPFSWDKNPNPICLAVMPHGEPINSLALYENHVYIFASSNINETTVYKENIDGSGRQILAILDWNTDQPGTIIFQNGYAYLIGTYNFIDDEGMATSSNQELAVLSMNLQTGEVKQLTERMGGHYPSIIGVKLYDDYLLYNYVYFDDEMDFNAEEAIEKAHEYRNSYLYRIDLRSGEDEKILELQRKDEYLASFSRNGIYYYSHDLTKMYVLPLEGGQLEELFQGKDINPSVIEGHGIVYAQKNIYDGTLNYYDFATKKTKEIKRPEEETMPRDAYGKWFILTAKLEDGLYHTVVIEKEDYLKGKTNYITLH